MARSSWMSSVEGLRTIPRETRISELGGGFNSGEFSPLMYTSWRGSNLTMESFSCVETTT